MHTFALIVNINRNAQKKRVIDRKKEGRRETAGPGWRGGALGKEGYS